MWTLCVCVCVRTFEFYDFFFFFVWPNPIFQNAKFFFPIDLRKHFLSVFQTENCCFSTIALYAHIKVFFWKKIIPNYINIYERFLMKYRIMFIYELLYIVYNKWKIIYVQCVYIYIRLHYHYIYIYIVLNNGLLVYREAVEPLFI